jgi:hypothetical protein
MSISEELYTRLKQAIMPLVEVKHAHHLSNWLWIVSGILQSKSVAMGQIALHLPMETKAEARVTRIRRWLKNGNVNVWSLYRPILAHVLQDWQAAEAIVILDGVMVFGDRLQIFRLSLEHGCRAIPLGWVVLEGKGLTQVENLQDMLQQVADFLSTHVKSVLFLADRGFRDCDWANLCQKLGWSYGIRLASNTYVTLDDDRQVPIDRLGVQPGQSGYFQNVKVTQDEKLQGNLSITWTNGKRGEKIEIVAVISDRQAEKARLDEYAHRMRIEESFGMTSRVASTWNIRDWSIRLAWRNCFWLLRLRLCGVMKSANRSFKIQTYKMSWMLEARTANSVFSNSACVLSSVA